MGKKLLKFLFIPKRIYRMVIQNLQLCWWRCNNSMADYFHIFWNCPAIQSYWLMVVTEIESILGFEIDWLLWYYIFSKHTNWFLYSRQVPSQIVIGCLWKSNYQEMAGWESTNNRRVAAIVKDMFDIKQIFSFVFVCVCGGGLLKITALEGCENCMWCLWWPVWPVFCYIFTFFFFFTFLCYVKINIYKIKVKKNFNNYKCTSWVKPVSISFSVFHFEFDYCEL